MVSNTTINNRGGREFDVDSIIVLLLRSEEIGSIALKGKRGGRTKRIAARMAEEVDVRRREFGVWEKRRERRRERRKMGKMKEFMEEEEEEE